MEWTKRRVKVVFNNLGSRWAVFMLKIGRLDLSVTHDLKSYGIGVFFDKWLLSKQLTITVLTVAITATWYVNDNDNNSIYKY